jgi:hypothetical protein
MHNHTVHLAPADPRAGPRELLHEQMASLNNYVTSMMGRAVGFSDSLKAGRVGSYQGWPMTISVDDGRHAGTSTAETCFRLPRTLGSVDLDGWMGHEPSKDADIAVNWEK